MDIIDTFIQSQIKYLFKQSWGIPTVVQGVKDPTAVAPVTAEVWAHPQPSVAAAGA